MKTVVISGSNVGTKSRVAADEYIRQAKIYRPNADMELIDLAEKDMVFSDGRNYFEYPGDTGQVLKTIMAADVLVFTMPTFQASYPATVKNLFDLLPVNAFRDKVVGVINTAGSPRHYLMVETQLMPILNYMKATVVNKYVFIEERDFSRNEIVSDDIIFRIERLVDDVFTMADIQAEIQAKKDAAYGF